MQYGFWVWLDNTLKMFAGLWNWLTQPLIGNGDEVLGFATTPITILSLGCLLVCLVMKIVHMVNPIS